MDRPLAPPLAPGSGAARRARGGGRAVAAWDRALVLLALAKVAVSVGSAAGVSIPGRTIPPAVYLATVLVFALAGCALLAFGHRDPRARPLGIFFVLVADAFTVRHLLALARAAPDVGPALRFVAGLHGEAFLAWYFGRFARDFPRVRRLPGQPEPLRRTLALALAAGALLFAANAAFAFGPRLGWSEPAFRLLGRDARGSLFWPVEFLLLLPAGFRALRQARRAAPDERRRVRITVAGLLVGIAPIVAVTLCATVVPSFDAYMHRAEGVRTAGLFVYPALLSVPLVTAYAVLAHRALDLRLIVRRAVQYASARSALTALSAAPFLGVAALVYRNRGESIAALVSGETGIVLVAALACGVAAVRLQPRLAGAIDRRFFREQYDAHRVLASLVELLRAARDTGELARTLEGTATGALHLRSACFLAFDPAGGRLAPPAGAVPPLPIHWRLARALEEAGRPREVDWTRPPPWLRTLLPAERQWLIDADARLLVPCTAGDGSLLGVLCLGEKKSELPFSDEDRALLAAVASSAALWLEHRLPQTLDADTDAGTGEEAAARECALCGAVPAGAGEACACCGGPLADAAVPALIHGKYRVRARIGVGGMGVVYRAFDVVLDREVAVKTLPRVTSRLAARMRAEARAMAAVAHPNLAQIYSVDAWRGTPLLVVEYLAGGTLFDRLGHGPLPPREMVEVFSQLAAGLGRLHDFGILHRDVKPSNIGFAADRTPKLLDFGVAHVLDQAEPAGWAEAGAGGAAGRPSAAGDWAGTLLYLSPEAADGHPPDASFDLWALCMAAYEAVAGRHPFEGEKPHAAVLAILDAKVPDVRGVAPGVPAPVAAFLREALHRDRRRRPATAVELAARLQGLRAELSPG